jgi:hypothetical protein
MVVQKLGNESSVKSDSLPLIVVVTTDTRTVPQLSPEQEVIVTTLLLNLHLDTMYGTLIHIRVKLSF